MRDVKDLLLAKINYEVSSELKYQELMDLKKLKYEEEELPSSALDNSVDDLPSWESLEVQAWDLIISKGLNWKLFVLWLEFMVSAEGWDYCLEMINIFKNILLKKKEILDEEDTVEKKLLLIGYFDKTMGRCLNYSYIKNENPLFKYTKYINEKKFDLLYDILKIITDKNYEEYLNIYKNGTEILKGLVNIFPDFSMHFPCILDSLTNLNNVMEIYENEFLIEEDDEETEDISDSKIDIETIDDKKNNVKQEAFKKIAEAFEILKTNEPQELAVPLLRKILRWHHQTISETLNELSDQEGSYYILKFLKD